LNVNYNHDGGWVRNRMEIVLEKCRILLPAEPRPDRERATKTKINTRNRKFLLDEGDATTEIRG